MSDDEYEGTKLTADRQPENRIVVSLDALGYVVSARLDRSDTPDFLAVLRATRNANLIDAADIIMPPLWPVDEDGRGVTVHEHKQIVALAALLRLNGFAHHLTTDQRAAA